MITSRRPAPTRRRRAARLQLLLGGLLGIAVIAALMAVALTAQNGLPFARYRTLHADFAVAGDLQTYDDVRIAGHRVGQVSGIALVDHAAHVTLQLEASAPRLRAGTTATIRLDGLIGAEYVQLNPALHGPFLPAGATLRALATTPDVFDVLSTLDAQRRADLRTTLRGLGEGLLSRGADINTAIGDAPPLLRDADALLAELDAEPGADRRLLPDLDGLAGALVPARLAIADGFAPEADVAGAFAAESRNVEALLEQAPPTLAVAGAQLPAIDRLLAATDALAGSVTRLTRPAPAAFAAAERLLVDAPAALRRARPLLAAARIAIPVALALLDRVAPLSAPLARLLANTTPLLSSLAPRVCDLRDGMAWARSAASFGTPPDGPIGPENVVRVLVGENAEVLTGQPVPSGQIATDLTPAPCAATAEHLTESP